MYVAYVRILGHMTEASSRMSLRTYIWAYDRSILGMITVVHSSLVLNVKARDERGVVARVTFGVVKEDWTSSFSVESSSQPNRI